MRDFKRQYLTARKVIAEIKNGEWISEYLIDEKCYLVTKGDFTLWLANGPWFCDLEWNRNSVDSECINAFGLLFRHWVWHCGAKQLKRKYELANKVKKVKKVKHDYPLT